MKRTHLPLNALRVFDAAARHLSFTRAADELAVTPAAVGQQIRALEDMLGVVLFRRTSKGLELTDEALAGLEQLRSGFLQFEDAVQAMQAGQSSHVFAIAAPRDFFAAWLAPRLAAYRAANPDVRYRLIGDETADFTEANLDLAIRWAEGPDDLEGVALGDATLVTVTSENAASDSWIAWPGDPDPAGAGEAEAPLMMGDAGQAFSAAMAGMGRARIPALLAKNWEPMGRKILFGQPEACRRGYWLVAPLPQWRQKKVKALVAFLTGE